MSLQHNRIYALTIGNTKSGNGVRISNVPTIENPSPIGLQISFDLSKNANNKKNKNNGSIQVVNLAPTTLALLQESFVSITLEVGYLSTGLKLLYTGNVREFSTVQKGPDLITVLKVGEAYTALNHEFISKYVPAGKTNADVLKEIVDQMPGINLGGFAGINLSNPVTFGYSLHGTPQDMLDDLCSANGLEHRCSNNILTVSEEGGLISPSKLTALLLSKDTGMIGIPYTSSGTGEKAKKDVAKAMGVQVKSLLNASLVPGELIKIVSDTATKLNGFYRITACRYSGDFRGNDWYVDMFCSNLKVGVLTE